MLELEDWKTLLEIMQSAGNKMYVQNIMKALIAYDLGIDNEHDVECLYKEYL